MFKKGQAWSIDLIIGVVVFLLLIVILYSLLANQPVRDTALRQQADSVYSSFESKKSTRYGGATVVPRIVMGNAINQTALKDLYTNTTYDNIKAELGITGDFCIVLVDDEGAIIPVTNIDPVSGKVTDYYSAGNTNDKLYISENLLCGT